MASQGVATGLPFTLVFTDLIPDTWYSIKLSGGNFFTGHLEPDNNRLIPNITKYEFRFLAPGTRAEFVVGLALVKGLVSGTFQSGNNELFRLKLGQAECSSYQGNFALQTGMIDAPPTCANLGCGPYTNCPPSNPQTKCYGYMGTFWCCIDPPYDENGKPVTPCS